ncbi:MAG: SH3 domain-containing protein [Deltaproteobacteria bacterium]|nr:SH3 domain-containing protein [Deltaproteobacteria bacterium]
MLTTENVTKGGLRLAASFGLGAILLTGLLTSALVDPEPALAERVITSPRVQTYVFVREMPASGSPIIGTLHPNEEVVLVESTPGWYRVKLLNLAEGFVSSHWTRVIPGPDFCHAQEDADCVK